MLCWGVAGVVRPVGMKDWQFLSDAMQRADTSSVSAGLSSIRTEKGGYDISGQLPVS